MGFFTAFSRIVMDMTVVTVILLYLPGLPPNTTFESFTLRYMPFTFSDYIANLKIPFQSSSVVVGAFTAE